MMKSRVALFGLMLTSLLFPLEAATYYIRKDGNDANPGTGDTAQGAWLTLNKATAAVKPGDVVYVRRGTYQEYVNLTRSGNAEAPITWFGERDSRGNHLTIVDPSIEVSGDWTTAPEIGANVYKLGFSAFTPAHLSADDHVVMQFKLYDNAHLDLARASDSTINNTQWSAPQPFWDGIEAGWTYTNEFIYLRFRDNSKPGSHSIKVSDNQDGVRFDVNKAACLIKASYNRISGFVFQGTQFPVAFVGDNTYKEITGNIVESNKVQQGFGQIILIGSRSSECNVSRNIIRHNFLQHKGYWEKAGVTGGAVRYGDNASWPNFQYYWGTKHRWYAYGGGGFEHSHIVLCDVRDNNVIQGNILTNGVHGLRSYSQQMWNENITATGTVICSNQVHNLSGALMIHANGHDLLYAHDNQIQNAWLGVARLQAVNRNRAGQNRIYIYRNKLWNPPGKGQFGYFHLYNETDTFQSEVWFYHNSYEGGDGGMSVSAWASGLPNVLGKVAFLNNIFSTEGEPISSKYLTSASSLRGYDFNRSRAIANRPWVGGHNIILNDYEWGGSNSSLAPAEWQLDARSASIGSGINVGVPFIFMGKSFSALPGFSSGYSGLVTPNLGAVQSATQEPVTPQPEEPKEPEEPMVTFIASLDATDALLLDSYMSLQDTAVQKIASTQGNSPSYVTSSSTDRGSAHFHPTLPAAGAYTIWCRVMTTGADADSFYVSINGGAERIFESRTWAPVWHWTRLGTFQPSSPEEVEYSHYFRATVNEISFRGRDANTMLARMLITNDPEFVPDEVAANRVAVKIRQTNYGQVLKWASIAGTPYRVLYSPDFKSQPWTVAGEPIVAGGPETEWLAPKSQLSTGFYWVHAGM